MLISAEKITKNFSNILKITIFWSNFCYMCLKVPLYSPNQKWYKKMCKTKNVRNYDSGKVAKFQDAKISGFWVNLKKPQGGVESTPPGPNRVKLPMSLDIRSWLKQIVSIVEVFEIVLKIREIFFCVLEKN